MIWLYIIGLCYKLKYINISPFYFILEMMWKIWQDYWKNLIDKNLTGDLSEIIDIFFVPITIQSKWYNYDIIWGTISIKGLLTKL